MDNTNTQIDAFGFEPRKCRYCGEPISKRKRADSKYCNNFCKQEYNRLVQKENKKKRELVINKKRREYAEQFVKNHYDFYEEMKTRTLKKAAEYDSYGIKAIIEPMRYEIRPRLKFPNSLVPHFARMLLRDLPNLPRDFFDTKKNLYSME